MAAAQEETASCKHYSRDCALLAPCCKQFYPCRLCHDEDDSKKCLATMDRYAVTTVKCLKCGNEQEPTQECKKCGVCFGKYFCSTCRLYDHRDKGQYHCEPCGLCRVGGRDRHRHCERCCVCYSLQAFDAHKCLDSASKSNCPICMEYLHSSTRPLHVPACGHLLHVECMSQLSQTRYACPLCFKTLTDLTNFWWLLAREVQMTPMPAEYANTVVGILCNDCLGQSVVACHVVGHRCASCGSFNTRVTSGPRDLAAGEVRQTFARSQEEVTQADMVVLNLPSQVAPDEGSDEDEEEEEDGEPAEGEQGDEVELGLEAYGSELAAEAGAEAEGEGEGEEWETASESAVTDADPSAQH